MKSPVHVSMYGLPFASLLGAPISADSLQDVPPLFTADTVEKTTMEVAVSALLLQLVPTKTLKSQLESHLQTLMGSLDAICQNLITHLKNYRIIITPTKPSISSKAILANHDILNASYLANFIYQTSWIEAQYHQPQTATPVDHRFILYKLLTTAIHLNTVLDAFAAEIKAIAPKDVTTAVVTAEERALKQYRDVFKLPQVAAMLLNFIHRLDNALPMTSSSSTQTSLLAPDALESTISKAHQLVQDHHFPSLLQANRQYLEEYWDLQYRIVTINGKTQGVDPSVATTILLKQLWASACTEADLTTTRQAILRLTSYPTIYLTDISDFDHYFHELLVFIEQHRQHEVTLKKLIFNFADALLTLSVSGAQPKIGLYQPMDYALVLLIWAQHIFEKPLSLHEMPSSLCRVLSAITSVSLDQRSTLKQALFAFVALSYDIDAQLIAENKPTSTIAEPGFFDSLFGLNATKEESPQQSDNIRLKIEQNLVTFIKQYISINRIAIKYARTGHYLPAASIRKKLLEPIVKCLANNYKQSLETNKTVAGFILQRLLHSVLLEERLAIPLATIESAMTRVIADEKEEQAFFKTLGLQALRDKQKVKRATVASSSSDATSYTTASQQTGLILKPLVPTPLPRRSYIKPELLRWIERPAQLTPAAYVAMLDPYVAMLDPYVAMLDPMVGGYAASIAEQSASEAYATEASEAEAYATEASEAYATALKQIQAGKTPSDPILAEMQQALAEQYQHVNGLGHTPAHLAIISNNLLAFEMLLRHKDVAAERYQGNSLLHLAAHYGRHDMIAAILRHGAIPINQLNHLYQTALHLAVIAGHDQCVQDLMIAGIYADYRDLPEKTVAPDEAALGKTASDYAIALGNHELAQKLHDWTAEDTNRGRPPYLNLASSDPYERIETITQWLDEQFEQFYATAPLPDQDPLLTLEERQKAVPPARSLPSVARPKVVAMEPSSSQSADTSAPSRSVPLELQVDHAKITSQKNQIEDWRRQFDSAINDAETSADVYIEIVRTIILKNDTIENQQLKKTKYLALLEHCVASVARKEDLGVIEALLCTASVFYRPIEGSLLKAKQTCIDNAEMHKIVAWQNLLESTVTPQSTSMSICLEAFKDIMKGHQEITNTTIKTEHYLPLLQQYIMVMDSKIDSAMLNALILDAIDCHNSDFIIMLINQNKYLATSNISCEGIQTPLIFLLLMAENIPTSFIAALIEAKPELLEAHNDQGQTPLLFALSRNDCPISTTKLLITSTLINEPNKVEFSHASSVSSLPDNSYLTATPFNLFPTSDDLGLRIMGSVGDLAATRPLAKGQQTPLFLAVDRGDVATIEALIVHPALAIETRNADGLNVLHLLLQCQNFIRIQGCDKLIIKLLESIAAHHDTQLVSRLVDRKGNNLMHYAVNLNEQLMLAGFENRAVTIKHKQPLTAVLEAITQHFPGLVDSSNRKGQTPRTLAANENCVLAFAAVKKVMQPCAEPVLDTTPSTSAPVSLSRK